MPKVIKLSMETSLKSHASDWLVVAISANQMLLDLRLVSMLSFITLSPGHKMTKDVSME